MARRMVGTAIAGAAAMVGSVLALAGPAAAATAVTAGSVTPNPATAGSVSSYTVQLTTASALPAGGTITFQAPPGTAFVGCASGCSAIYGITVSGTDTATAGTATVSAIGGSRTPNQLVLALSASTIAAGDQVTVSTKNTSNPTLASSSYTFSEFTSADTTPVSSAPYTIYAGPPAGLAMTGGNDQSAQVGTAFARPLSVTVSDAYNNPVPGVTVHFSAPVGGASGSFAAGGCPADPPSTPATDCYASTGSGGVATSGTFTANFTSGSYHVTGSASTIYGSQAVSFTLTNTSAPARSVTPGAVHVSNPEVTATGVNYTAGFTTTSAVPSGGTIQLTFPNGTSLPGGSCLLGCSGYTVTYGTGSSASVSAVATSAVVGPGSTSASSTPNQVVLTLGGLLGSGLPAGTAVTVAISGVTNPAVASSSYVAEESTSADPGVVATTPYAITAAPATTLRATSGGGQTALTGGDFASPLVATAYDSSGNPVPGTQVTFTIGSSSGGASATFANHTTTETDTAAGNGQATTSQITANNTYGSYTVTARLLNGASPVTYTLMNTAYVPPTNNPGPGAPATMTIRAGDQQSATVATAYATALSVIVTDSGGSPVSGASVLFAAPSSGASGHFSGGSNTETDTTNSSGVATASQFTANTVAGYVAVTASTTGQVGVVFNLTNTAGAPTAVKMVSGQNQTATVNTAFAEPFVAEAVDQYGNPVPFSGMLFGGPTGGPGGTFTNGKTYETDTANDQGQATSTTFTANGIAGSYQMAAGLSTSNYTLFNETNTYGGSTNPGGTGGGTGGGYWLAAPDGAVQAFGDAGFYGSAFGAPLAKPVVGLTGAPGGNGYWLVASDGGVFNYGPGARFHGSAGGINLAQPIVGMAADPATGGYWLVASDGGVFSYGAPFYGSTGGIRLNKPIVGMAAAPGGNGYWLVASDGGVFSFGPGARFYGSTGNIALNKPVVGMAAAPGGTGYWLVASDGGIFSFGSGARFYGSTGNIALDYPVVGMASAPGGAGYWLVALDGGVFSFGPGAPFHGSAAREGVPVIGMAAD